MLNPLCEICSLENKVTPAEHTHHVLSFMKGRDHNEKLKLLLDNENLMCLCKECHGYIHGNKKQLT